MMNLRNVVINLNVNEIQQILAIDMDNDSENALLFLKENISRKVKKALESR